jgi:hypothetical protein
MMRQPVEHGCGHFGVAEHLGPVGEGEVCGDQQGGVFVELADHVEEQLAAGLAEREIAQFVDDDEVIAQQVLREPTATAGGLLLFELIDEIDQVEETPSGAGANDRRGHRDAEVGFARARRDSDMAPGFWRVKR